MSIIGWAAVGGLAGVHAASWGAYKDSPFEGFRWTSGVRSVVLAALIAMAVVRLTPLGTGSDLVIVALVVYAGERLATEGWKAILREDDQSAFTIPMRLGVGGRTVDHRGVRYAAGGLLLAAIVGVGVGVRLLQSSGVVPWWLLVAALGGGAGWATAVGGAWKDAPIEGFSGWKFLRSPVVATAWAVVLSPRTDDVLVLGLAAGGAAVASIETWKTFFTGDRAPGKFDGRSRVSVPAAVRTLAGSAHALVWLALAGVVVVELVDRASPAAALGSVVVVAVVLALVTGVLRHTLRHTLQAFDARLLAREVGAALSRRALHLLTGTVAVSVLVALISGCGSVALPGPGSVDEDRLATAVSVAEQAGHPFYWLGERAGDYDLFDLIPGPPGEPYYVSAWYGPCPTPLFGEGGCTSPVDLSTRAWDPRSATPVCGDETLLGVPAGILSEELTLFTGREVVTLVDYDDREAGDAGVPRARKLLKGIRPLDARAAVTSLPPPAPEVQAWLDATCVGGVPSTPTGAEPQQPSASELDNTHVSDFTVPRLGGGGLAWSSLEGSPSLVVVGSVEQTAAALPRMVAAAGASRARPAVVGLVVDLAAPKGGPPPIADVEARAGVLPVPVGYAVEPLPAIWFFDAAANRGEFERGMDEGVAAVVDESGAVLRFIPLNAPTEKVGAALALL